MQAYKHDFVLSEVHESIYHSIDVMRRHSADMQETVRDSLTTIREARLAIKRADELAAVDTKQE
jgi:hypothetical protein